MDGKRVPYPQECGLNRVRTTFVSTRIKIMDVRQKQLWIGMVEVRPTNGKSEILGDMKGAFVNIVTWASDAKQYRRNAELIVGKLGGLYVSEVVNAEPVEVRRARTGGGFEEDIEDMI